MTFSGLSVRLSALVTRKKTRSERGKRQGDPILSLEFHPGSSRHYGFLLCLLKAHPARGAGASEYLKVEGTEAVSRKEK